jgi:RHS repeat-associated protein
MVVSVGVPVAVAAGAKPDEQTWGFTDVPAWTSLPEVQRPQPDIAGVAAQVTAAANSQRDLMRFRATDAQQDVRVDSQDAFSDMGRSDALKAAEQAHPDVLSSPAWEPLQLRSDERVAGYLNDHTIRIDRTNSGVDALAVSLDPVLARDEHGDKKPVDMTLQHDASGFVPANSPVDVRLPDDVHDAITLGTENITLRPQLTGPVSSGVQVEGKVFYANVATDTDFMAAAVPSGVETFEQLRSQASPEDLPLLFDLPAGAHLRLASGAGGALRPVAIEIVRDDTVLATISKPTAVDGDGVPVRVDMSTDGADRVTMHVAHRDADVKYPILVDPVINDAVTDDYNWQAGGSSTAGWLFGSVPANYFGVSTTGSAGSGLYIAAYANGAYSSGQYGQWGIFAPGTSYIYRTEFGHVTHLPSNSYVYEGIWSTSQNRWEAYWNTSASLSNNWRTQCITNCGWAGTPGNMMVFGMIMAGRPGSSGAYAYMGQAMVLLHDDDLPTVTTSGTPSGWVHGDTTTTVNSRDTGLGVRAAGVLSDSHEADQSIDLVTCGDKSFRCPNTSSVTFTYGSGYQDGVRTMTAMARDAINHYGSSAPWTLKLDTTAPQATVSGSLRSMEDKELSNDTYRLSIDALDQHPTDQSIARSGVQSIEVQLDGTRAYYDTQPAQACPGAGCAMHRDWDFQPFAQDLSVGAHRLRVIVTDYAGNLDIGPTWHVQIARGAMLSPNNGDISENSFKLHAIAKRPGYTYASYQYRKAPSDPWNTITTHLRNGVTDITGPIALGSDGSTPTLVWDASAAGLGGDTALQLRAVFGTAASGSGMPGSASPSTTVNTAYRRNGIGADYARQSLAPGQVDLLTGNFVMSTDDVSINAPTGDLTISRTYASQLAPGQTGPFGPGWLASGTIAAAGADYVNITEPNVNPTLALVDGTSLQFTVSGTGTYLSPPGHEDLTLTKAPGASGAPGVYTLADSDGDTTTFTSQATGDWRPTSIKTSADNSTSTLSYSTVGSTARLTTVRAPVPAGVANCTPNSGGALPAGCRELHLTYATSTTATGNGASQWGDYAGQLQTVTFFSGDPGMPTTGVDVATYRYNNVGRLRAEWDPRISPALQTTYDYNGDSLLSQVTPPGEASWNLTYQPIGGDQPGTGRLRAITRTGPSGTATRTIVYNVALSGTGAPYPMDASSSGVGQWAQTDTPTAATAIFPADTIPSADTVDSATKATVYYLNASGRLVNLAEPGGNISTTEYDDQHNVIRSLTAANRARVLAAAPADRAALAHAIDSQSTYAANGLEQIEQLGPRHAMVIDGQSVQARRHTLTDYDTGGLHLPVRVSAGALVDGQSTDSDVRITTSVYNAKLRQPTSTTVDPTGLNLTTSYSYDDATGQEISRTLPKGSPGTASAYTTKTTLYTADGTGACPNNPAWAGLPCRIEPAAQPSGTLPQIPVKTVTYNRWRQPLVTTETVGGTNHSRTTTVTYDEDGRFSTESVSATSGTAVPTVTHTYSPATGREINLQTTSPLSTISRVYDSLGRMTSYQDADGAVSTAHYDLRDRLTTSDDGKGTQSRTYDPTTGRLATVTDSQAGVFTATYDPDGTITSSGLPNGLTVTSTIDETGQETRRVYTKSDNCGASCTWLDSRAPLNAHEQRASQTTTTQTGPLSQTNYSYDPAGRLLVSTNTVGGSACTVRQYGYDANSNRATLTTKPPASDGTCQPATTGATTTSTYDEADRLSNQGVDYDAFGRTLTVPTASPGVGAIASSYYVNDRTRTLTQDALTQTYSLDPARRVEARVTSGTASATETDHYSDDSDSPSWIASSVDGSTYTRQIEGIDGDLGAVRDSNGVRLQLSNVHGDIVAEAATSPTATSLVRSGDDDEFGVPRTAGANRNQWLGAKQRSTELSSGAIAMGQRMYLPSLGRFLQVDPVLGGSANSYDYANEDPTDIFDLDGRTAPSPCSYMARRWRGAKEMNAACHALGGKPLPKPRKNNSRAWPRIKRCLRGMASLSPLSFIEDLDWPVLLAGMAAQCGQGA